MSDRHTIVGGALLGAVLGAVTGYLFFTEKGRRFRRQIEPELQTIVQEALQIRKTVTDLRQSRSQTPRAESAASPIPWPRRS
ncbi:MAG: YtxH domain-containing protein [Vicinamibacterales bacterium]